MNVWLCRICGWKHVGRPLVRKSRCMNCGMEYGR